MIRLDIRPYCGSCFDFEPDVTRPIKETSYMVKNITNCFAGDEVVVTQSDTIVRCKYANRCEAIKRYLDQQTKGVKH